MKYFSRMTYICVLILSLMAWIPSAQVSAANSHAASPVPLALADEATTDVFTATTIEGVEMTFKVISESEKTCQVGADGNKAINQVTSGPVTIPATANGYSVVTIDTQAFYWCENITSVVIPNTVTRIEYGAFSNCTSIESITIPASVTYIDSYAFGRNTSLMSYSVDEANPRFTSKDGMLLNKAGNTLRAFPAGIEGEIVIPAYITDVSSGAFTGCSLSKLTFPENVIYVGSFAVTDCRNLQHVVWNASYQYINSCCFRYNGSLSNIELSEGLIFIGYEAFEGASMAEMVIPSSVTSIGGIAFSYCRSLERITLTTNVSTIEEQAFNHSANIKEIIIKEEGDGMLNSSINDNTFEEDVYQNATLYVPAGTSDFFKNANGWKKFQNIVEREGEPNSMPYIVWCKDNSTLYFLSSNTEVKKGGTYDGQTITDVWSGEDVTNTEQNEIVGQFSPPRFRWTTGECTRVVFDKSFETVRVRSTSDWFNSKLESIEGLEYLNTSEVTSMSYMFGGLKLSNLDLSHFDTHKVKYMHSMFEYCSGLTDLDLSHFDTRNVQSMAYMFSNCPNLKSIDLSSFDTRNVVNMSNMFRESTALTTLDLSSFNTSNVTTMRQMCYGCSNLTSIDMSSFDTGKVTDMWLMFSQCVALKTIYAGDGWSTVNVTDGSWMFGSCTSLVGGRGTVYDENNPHYTYAHIDGGSSNPGYFTDKNALEEDIEAAKQDLLNMIYACMEGRDYVQKNLSDKASESQAPELYQQMSEIDERLEHARYLLDKVTSMEELKDVQAMTYEIRERLEYLNKQVESFETPSTFIAKTVEGIDMTFMVLSAEDKTCQAGPKYSNSWNDPVAIDKTTKGHVTIPAVANGYTVTVIGEDAFRTCGEITSVEIPSSVKTIETGAFQYCEKLASVNIPNSVTTIGVAAFRNCALTSVVIPSSVTQIGAYYDRNAFQGCPSLQSIVVEADNEVFDSRDNCNAIIKTSTNELYTGCKNTAIPNSVAYIVDYAYYGCSGLTALTITKNIQYIGPKSFAECRNLSSIQVENGNPMYDSRNNCNAVIETSSNKLVLGCRGTTIPEGVTCIGESAFMGCGITALEIPNSVNTIEREAFLSCDQLSSVKLPEGLTKMVYAVFYGCSSLKSIVIPESVTEIGDCVFQSSGLENIIIPDNVTIIDFQAFVDCQQLKEITIGAGVKTIGHIAFYSSRNIRTIISYIHEPFAFEDYAFGPYSDVYEKATLYVPYGTKSLYETTQGWSKFLNIVETENNNVPEGALITSVSQLSSPFTEPTEGSLAALIDNNSNTFWHSIWTTGEVEGGLHYFQVEMPDMSNIDYVKFQFTRRNIENDQTVLWGVYGTNDFDASKEACTKLGEFSTPFSSTTETLTSEAFRHNGFKYLRFYSEIQEGWAYSARGYFHIAEFQLYPAEGSVEFERQLMATKNIDDVTYSVYKKILSKDDYHVNADGTSYYRTEICLDITKNGSTHTYTIDNNLYMDEQPTGMMPCMMFDLGTQTMYVFCLSKNEEVNYGMEGHVYVSSMRSVSFEKEIVFSDQNWGWWASFAGLSGGCPQLLHFSFAGYNKMTSVRKSDGSWITAYDEHIYPDDYETLWKERSLILIVTDGGQDLNLSQYEAALEVIEPNAKFRIFTQSNGTTEGTKKYYLTADGYLTDSEDEAYLFTFGRTEGDELFVSPGWKLDIPFSNPHLTNGATGDLPLHGHIRTDYYNGFRDNWEGQVWYKKGDRYAVRSTNSVSSEWGADTYWTVLDSDGNGLPEAEYSLTPNFVWQLEEDQNYIRVALNLIYDGEVIATIPSIQEIGSTIVTPSDFENGLVTLFCDVDTITADTHEANFTAVWNGLFEFSTSYDTANWYNMTIRSNYYVGMDETEPYFPSAEKELWDASNQWAFMGNPYNLIIINRAAGSGQSLMQDDFNVVMRDGEFIWEPFGNYDGFVIRPAGGGSDEWVNQNGGKEGPLQFWVDTYGRYDDGSTFRILEIPDKSVYDELLASAVAQAASVEGLIPRAANEALLAVVAANNHEYTSTTQYNAAINSINSATGLYASTEMREAYSRYLALAQDFETVLETEGLEEREEGALAAYQQAMTLANELVEVTTSTDALVEAATDAKATMREALLNLLAAVAPVDGHPLDITFLLENPDFEEGGEPMMGILPGWMCTFVKGETATNIGYMPNAYNSNGVSSAVGDTYVNGSVRIQHFMEAWQDNSGSRVIGDGKLYQTLSGLPVGWYRLTTDVIAVNQYDSSKNPIAGAYIYISSGQIETTTEIYTGNGLPEHFEVDFINDHAESLDFGLKTLSSTANWIAADNFYIYYVSELKESPGVASLKETLALYEDVTFGPCNRGVLSAFTAEREHAIEMTETNIYSLAHSSECLEEKTILQNKYNDVLASVAAYESYQQSVNKVLARLNSVQDANSPLALSLTDLADELQQGINDGNAVADRYQNIDNQISDIVNYWKFHFSESDLAILREALQQMGNQPSWENRWNLNAEQLSLDGITNTEGRVTAVQLNGRGLTGSVPTALFALEKTSSFNLSGNKLSSIQGTVPQGKTLNIRNQQLDQVINVNIGKNDASLVLSQLPSILCYQNSAGGATSHFAFNVISEDYSFTLSENNGTLQVTSRSSYIYQGEKNAVMACTSTYGDATGSTLNLRFMFDDGDANFDGSLNVLDLQTSINYIMEKYQSRPYNFTAANLWKDDIINVQDIICQVNLLMNMEQAEAEGSVKRKVTGKESSAEVCLFIKDGKLMLSTETPVAAFDITLQGVNSLKVSPDLTQTGITCTTKRGKTGVRIIGYSLADAVIPAGVNTLATLSGTASTSVLEAMLSDSEANAISIRYDGLVTGVSSVNQPVPDAIYDMQGRKVQRPTSKGLYIQNGRKFVKK